MGYNSPALTVITQQGQMQISWILDSRIRQIQGSGIHADHGGILDHRLGSSFDGLGHHQSVTLLFSRKSPSAWCYTQTAIALQHWRLQRLNVKNGKTSKANPVGQILFYRKINVIFALCVSSHVFLHYAIFQIQKFIKYGPPYSHKVT